jgi:hypothetical protein
MTSRETNFSDRRIGKKNSGDWNNTGKSKIGDKQKKIKLAKKVLNGRFSHTVACGVTAACAVFHAVSRPNGSETEKFR